MLNRMDQEASYSIGQSKHPTKIQTTHPSNPHQKVTKVPSVCLPPHRMPHDLEEDSSVGFASLSQVCGLAHLTTLACPLEQLKQIETYTLVYL